MRDWDLRVIKRHKTSETWRQQACLYCPSNISKRKGLQRKHKPVNIDSKNIFYLSIIISLQ